VAHPFVSLLVAVEMGPEDADRDAIRDAYLAPWAADHDRDHLHRSAAFAGRIGPVSRAAAWERALRDANLPRDDEWRKAVSGWLESVLAD
jgi:hypothetical protein